MLCPSECAFPFIAHYVNENKIKNKDTVTGEIKQETKAINLPRNPACPPVALQLWLVLFLTNRYKDWGKSVTWTLREYSSQKGQKKKKKESSDEQDDGIWTQAALFGLVRPNVNKRWF